MSKQDEEKKDERRGRGNRGGRGGGRGNQHHHQNINKPKTAEEAIPILKYGPGNNWIEFKKRMAIAATEKYRNLGRIIEQEVYYVPPEITFDPTTLDPAIDPFGINKAAVLEQVKERLKQIDRMREDRPSLYAFIMSKLSRESEDELKRHDNYATFHEEQNPLELWKAIKELHLVTTTSKCASVVKQQATEDYHKLRQGDFETLTQFKERFENKLQAYNSAKGINEAEEESAMQFLSKLCRSRYAQYYAFKMNQINSDETKTPKTINEIYLEAMTWLSINTSGNKPNNKGASFATGDGLIKRGGKRDPDGGKGKGKGKGKGEEKNEKNEEVEPKGEEKPTSNPKGNDNKEWLKDIECYNCNEFGHMARDCPKKKNFNGMTIKDQRYAPKWYEVGLDSLSQVNVMNSRFLKNIRPGEGSFGGLDGNENITEYEGDLEGFFPVQVCDDCRASVLCYSDVEDLYPISNQRGISFTVHTPSRDIVFYKRDKIYLADFRDWINTDDNYDSPLSMITTSMNEKLYTKKQVEKAKEAGLFIKNAGFPSAGEAIKMARAGNVTNMPVDATDIKLYYEIYGQPVEEVRGKMTASSKVNKSNNYDEGVKMQLTFQDMTSDVMYAGGKKFLISIASPLELIITVPVLTLGILTLGNALQSHLDLIRMFGFEAKLVRVDPLKALAALRGKFPGTEIDITGAGDHLPKVDIRIRRIKEVARSVIASLDWKLPKSMVEDLITYCVSRLNIRSSGSLNGFECPRVRLTGRKIDYKREFALSFGDYVEARNPKVKSNNISQPRTEPCIALYPTPTINGSWKLLNLVSKKKVTRTRFAKMKTTPENIVRIMNNIAGEKYVTSEQFHDNNTGVVEEMDDEEPPAATHTPNEIVFLDEYDEEVEDKSVEEVEEVVEEKTDKESEEQEGSEDEFTEEEEQNTGVKQSDIGQRKSQRATAGVTSRFDQYDLNGLTRGYGMAAANIKLKVAMEKYGSAAREAIIEELTQLVVMKKALIPKMWKDIKNNKNATVLLSHLILREKYDAKGIFEKMKARLVGDGRGQNRDDFNEDEVASPTASLESIFNVLKISVEEERAMLVVDVGVAYLNATIDEDIYIILDVDISKILIEIKPELKKYLDSKGRLLMKIERALYGLIQSAKRWYETLAEVLEKNGFKQNMMDKCVFNKLESDGTQTTVVVYVDDLLITSKRKLHVYNVKDLIQQEFTDIKIKEGNELTYLGMVLKRNDKGDLEIEMKAYIKNVIDEWKGTHQNKAIRPYVIPAESNLFNDDEETLSKNGKAFHRAVAQLLYLSKRGRPDIALPIAYLCTRVKEPTNSDEKKLERVLGYLNNTINKVRTIKKTGKQWMKFDAYIDAAFAPHMDGKSHSGAALFVGGTLIEAISCKQKCIARDSTEAELIALSDIILDVEWHADWFLEQGYNMGKPTVFQDNTSTISLVTQGGGKLRTKHMRARKGIVLEGYEKDMYNIKYIPTDEMIADMLTKSLDGWKFNTFCKMIMRGIDDNIANGCCEQIDTAGVRCAKCTRTNNAQGCSTETTMNKHENFKSQGKRGLKGKHN